MRQRRHHRPPVLPLLGSAGALAGLGIVGLTVQAGAATPADNAATISAAAPTASTFQTFDAMVKIPGCSGAVVRFPRAKDSDKALVLTNGHCVQPEPARGSFIADKPATGRAEILHGDKPSTVTTVALERLVYATEHGTDAAVYRLASTYAQLQAKGVTPRPMATERHAAGLDIQIPSGYWKRNFTCRTTGFVPELREDGYVWKDSIRFEATQPGSCETIHGTSGSPMIDPATGAVIGINNTINEQGERCTNNNPCEVDDKGAISVRKGQRYGQQTYQFDTCFKDGTIDLTVAGCRLTGAKGA